MKHILVLLALVGMSAHASYEKSIMWGGRSAGIAGIATPYVQDSTAIYFNPAGLVGDKTGHDIAFNISPVSSQYKGPINNQNEVETSQAQLSTPAGLTYSYSPNDKWGFGIGYYVSAGSKTKFEGVNFNGTPAGEFQVGANLAVYELAIGAGYKVSDSLKVGAAFRGTMETGSFSFIQRTASPTIVTNPEINDLKGSQWQSFKLGAQWKMSENTSFGLTYRSQTDISVKGKFGGSLNNNGTLVPFQENDVTVHTVLPQSVTLGGMHKFSDMWNGYAQYAWYNYARVRTVDTEGVLTYGVPAQAQTNPAVAQHWSDRHTIALAGEYMSSWPVRFGLLYSSRNTSKAYARASFIPPGPSYGATIGTGKSWGDFRVDGGVEYVYGSATSENEATADIRHGDYSVSAYTLHMGVGYAF